MIIIKFVILGASDWGSSPQYYLHVPPRPSAADCQAKILMATDSTLSSPALTQSHYDILSAVNTIILFVFMESHSHTGPVFGGLWPRKLPGDQEGSCIDIDTRTRSCLWGVDDIHFFLFFFFFPSPVPCAGVCLYIPSAYLPACACFLPLFSYLLLPSPASKLLLIQAFNSKGTNPPHADQTPDPVPEQTADPRRTPTPQHPSGLSPQLYPGRTRRLPGPQSTPNRPSALPGESPRLRHSAAHN